VRNFTNRPWNHEIETRVIRYLLLRIFPYNCANRISMVHIPQSGSFSKYNDANGPLRRAIRLPAAVPFYASTYHWSRECLQLAFSSGNSTVKDDEQCTVCLKRKRRGMQAQAKYVKIMCWGKSDIYATEKKNRRSND